MSSSLFWRPIPKELKDRSLSYQLKFYIAEKLWGHDGSLTGEWVELRADEWQSYLQGVHDSTQNKELKQDIQRVFKLWEKYDGVIQVSLES